MNENIAQTDVPISSVKKVYPWYLKIVIVCTIILVIFNVLDAFGLLYGLSSRIFGKTILLLKMQYLAFNFIMLVVFVINKIKKIAWWLPILLLASFVLDIFVILGATLAIMFASSQMQLIYFKIADAASFIINIILPIFIVFFAIKLLTEKENNLSQLMFFQFSKDSYKVIKLIIAAIISITVLAGGYYWISILNNLPRAFSSCRGSVGDNQEEACYTKFALEREMPSICGNISSGFDTGPQSEINCYFKMAKQIGDPKICEKIKQRSKIAMFILVEDYYNCLAVTSKDPLVCYTEESLKRAKSGGGSKQPLGYCIGLAAVAQKSTEPCKLLLDYPLYQDDCYARVARTLKDQNICMKIGEVSEKNLCIDEVTAILNGSNVTSQNTVVPSEP